MSIRKKALWTIFLTGLGFLGAVSLAVYVDQQLIWLAVLPLAAAWVYSFFALRCTECGAAMFSKRKFRLWGVDFNYWGGFTIPKACVRCGARF